MFGIPLWTLATIAAIAAILFLYIGLTDIYLTRLYVPESVEWDEQPGICDECMGGRDVSQYCEHWGACHD